MKTIKTKLFLIFFLCMIVFVFCNILLNTVLLEKFYVFKNREVFQETYQEIRTMYNNKSVKIEDMLKEHDRVDGITSTISDRNMNIKFSSYPLKSSDSPARLPGEFERLVRENGKRARDQYIYSIVETLDYQVREIAFIARLDNGDLLVLRKPMKGISESTTIANQFFALSGSLIILIGGVLIYLFTRKITKPIIDMSNTAESIANLDFTKRVDIDSEDEVGSLGRSINQMSEKLSYTINALREDVERRKLLVRNMSHELKTPIGVIKGYAEGLKFGVAEDKDKAEKYCNVIAAECDRMDGMVRELLQLSMLESGTFKMNITNFDVSELAKAVIDKFSPFIKEKGITLKTAYETELYINADYELIERAVNNILTNAINHIDEKRRLEIGVKKVEEWIRISVYNSGPLLEPHDMKNIWDVFYKVDKARTRQYGGHGLGLSIVRMIAGVHGGRYGVENVMEGVLFYLEIPGKNLG